MVNPKIGETIYDPFCGTGGMLITAFKHISENMINNKKTLKFYLKKLSMVQKLLKQQV